MTIRTALLLCLTLISCNNDTRLSADWGEPLSIKPDQPPRAIDMVQVLLENQSLPLKGTGCEGSTGDEKRTLQHCLALALGAPLADAKHEALISGDCRSAAKFSVAGGGAIDAWSYELAVVERNDKREFVASSVIQFGLTKDKWRLIPETLRCYVRRLRHKAIAASLWLVF